MLNSKDFLLLLYLVIMEKNEPEHTNTATYCKRFSQDRATELFEIIEKHLRQNNRYRNSHYTQAQLAEELNIPRRYVIASIFKCTGYKYNQFINLMRMNSVMRMMHAANCQHMTIEDIAFMAGYASRQGFYIAFKRMYGCSPHIYRKGIVINAEE